MTKGNFGGVANCTHWIGCSFWVTFRTWSYVWCLNCIDTEFYWAHLKLHQNDFETQASESRVFQWDANAEQKCGVFVFTQKPCTQIVHLIGCSKASKSKQFVYREIRKQFLLICLSALGVCVTGSPKLCTKSGEVYTHVPSQQAP